MFKIHWNTHCIITVSSLFHLRLLHSFCNACSSHGPSLWYFKAYSYSYSSSYSNSYPYCLLTLSLALTLTLNLHSSLHIICSNTKKKEATQPLQIKSVPAPHRGCSKLSNCSKWVTSFSSPLFPWESRANNTWGTSYGGANKKNDEMESNKRWNEECQEVSRR